MIITDTLFPKERERMKTCNMQQHTAVCLEYMTECDTHRGGVSVAYMHVGGLEVHQCILNTSQSNLAAIHNNVWHVHV